MTDLSSRMNSSQTPDFTEDDNEYLSNYPNSPPHNNNHSNGDRILSPSHNDNKPDSPQRQHYESDVLLSPSPPPTPTNNLYNPIVNKQNYDYDGNVYTGAFADNSPLITSTHSTQQQQQNASASDRSFATPIKQKNNKTCCCGCCSVRQCLCGCSIGVLLSVGVILLVFLYILPTFGTSAGKAPKIPQFPPEAPNVPSIVNYSNTQVEIEWNEPKSPDATILRYHVQATIEATIGNTTDWTLAATVTEPTAIITDLLGSTGYCFRACAISSIGAGNFSESNCTFTDPAEVPTSPTSMKPTNTSSDSLTLVWGAADRNGDPLQSYDVEHSTAASRTSADKIESLTDKIESSADKIESLTDKIESSADKIESLTDKIESLADKIEWKMGCKVTDLNSNNQLNCTIGSLLENTKYFLRVRASNAIGNGSWFVPSEEFFTNTNNPRTPQAPTAPKLTDVTTTYIALAWNVENTGGAMTLENEVQMRKGDEGFIKVYSDFQKYTTITRLEGNISYCFRVRARNTVGWGFWTNVTCFKTLQPRAPNIPILDRIPVNTSSTSITVKWSEPNNNGRPITVYTLQTNDWWTDAPLGLIYNGTRNQYDSDTNLFPSVTYDFRVRAANSIGQSEYSAEVNYSTNRAGNCGNPEDAERYKATKTTMKGDIQGCLIGCKLNPGPDGEQACVVSCVEDKVGLSRPCSECWYENGECILNNCVLPCLNPSGALCERCAEDNCFPATIVCAGVPKYFFPP